MSEIIINSDHLIETLRINTTDSKELDEDLKKAFKNLISKAIEKSENE